jgi:hypothetical protein
MISIDLPEGITFEVPRDYAKYCDGHPVGLASVLTEDRQLHIHWDEQFVGFASSGVEVQVDRHSLLGLLLSESEELLGMTICSLRLGISEELGGVALLPNFTSDHRVRDTFASFVQSLVDNSIPVKVFASVHMMANDRETQRG